MSFWTRPNRTEGSIGLAGFCVFSGWPGQGEGIAAYKNPFHLWGFGKRLIGTSGMFATAESELFSTVYLGSPKSQPLRKFLPFCPPCVASREKEPK
ncbi:hypothetical protein BJV74DRAFT_850189 [Russula compacta]|nr:hypothetical protein BJV74DRAFT_850189 [Russula compacta]